MQYTGEDAPMIEIYMYEDIGDGLARGIAAQLDQAKGQDVLLRISSRGGSVSEALAIVGAMHRHGRVDTAIDGLAASSASVIAVSGRNRTIAGNALIMIHAPWVVTEGNAEELRRTADVVEKHGEQMRDIYQRATGQPRATVEKWLAEETWFDSSESLTAGLVDEISDPLLIAASMRKQIHNMGFIRPPTFEDSNMSDSDMNKDNNPKGHKIQQPDLQVVESVMAAERKRRSDIRMCFQGVMKHSGVPDLLESVLDDHTISVQAASDLLLAKLGEGSSPLHPEGHSPSCHYGENRHHHDFRAAVLDALLIRGGVKVDNPHPAAQDFRGYTMNDIARARLSQFGKRTDGLSRSDMIQAALTTSDLPELLADTANKAAMTGFRNEAVSQHRQWCGEGELPDFKTAKRVALSEAPGLDEIPERGEYKDGSLSDAAESVSIATFGKIISLSRQMMINDDLGEFTRLPEAMGQAAVRKEADLVYGVLTANPTMRDGKALFHADHNNYIASGSGVAPSVISLSNARAAMKRQKGLAGQAFLNIQPRYLIVPVALETVADTLMASITPITVDEVVPEWVKNLIVISDPRLDEVSETAWYLAASPMAHDTVDVLRLSGEPVFIDQQNQFDTDALRLKVRIDVGAAAIDWRGIYYNAGA